MATAGARRGLAGASSERRRVLAPAGDRRGGLSRRAVASGLGGLGAALAACAPPDGAGARPARPLKSGIRLMWASTDPDPGRIAMQNEEAALFQRRFPGITVELVPDGENVEKIKAGIAAGSPIDLASVRTTDYPGLARQGAIVGLDPLIKRDRFDMNALFSRTVPLWQWRSTQWAMPTTGVLSAFINLGLTEDSGVPRPPGTWNDPAWDWNSFLDFSRKLTRREGDRGLQWGFSRPHNNLRFYMAWVWSHGGEMFDKDLTRVALGDPPALEGLQLLADLFTRHRVAPLPDELSTAGSANSAFATGKLGINVTSTGGITVNRRVQGLRWTIIPMPPGPRGAFIGGGGGGWSLLRGAAYHDETWELLKFLYTPEADLVELRVVGLPKLRSSARDPLFLNPAEPPGTDMRVVAEALDKALRIDPVLLQGAEVFRIVNGELGDAFIGKQSVRAAITTIKSQVEPMLPAERQ